MERYAKGLALIAACAWIVACGGASSPSPPPAPAPAVPEAPQPPTDPAAPPQNHAPEPKSVAVFYAEPRFVDAGESTELVWSAPGESGCTASGGWSGARPIAGRETSPAISGPTEFTLTCGDETKSIIVAPEPSVRVTDAHGRELGGSRGLVLVDWDGQMANPAIRFYVTATENAELPLSVRLSAANPRLQFNKPSVVSEDGPSKRFKIEDDKPVEVLVANFPDRNFDDDEHELVMHVTDAVNNRIELSIPMREIDHDRAASDTLQIHVDYSHDDEGYFDDPAVRQTATDAARTWAHFIDHMSLAQVPAGAEKTYIWTSHPDGYVQGYQTTNRYAYTGMLLYLYGFTSELGYSAAIASSYGGWQHSQGQELPLRRSGMVAIELAGTYDRLGWLTANGSDRWGWGWGSSTSELGADLYSTVVHEVGHVLMMSSPIPRAKHYNEVGRIDDEAVRAYFGSYPLVDHNYHLPDAVDPESLKSAWGTDMMGPMANGRRLITKLDLLMLRSVGWRLRPVTALLPLTLQTASLPNATRGAPYAVPLTPSGGIPFYDWHVTEGQLPPGLELDRFDGVIYGTPTESGTYTFTVSVTDYPPRADTATRSYTVTVG